MESPLPDILEYAQYRPYLRDSYAARKASDKRFSHRFINNRAGVKSAGWFADLPAGRQRLRPGQIPALAEVFKLAQREREGLKVLVEMEQAENPAQLSEAYSKWLELKGTPRETLARDRFKYFERWYYPALRELISLMPRTVDHEALAARLNPAITARQAKEAVAVLERLGLLMPNSDPLPVLVKDTTVKTSHWRSILKAYMKLSLTAVDRFHKEERNLSALTLTLSPESLRQAGEEIAALRKRLLMLSFKDRKRNRVFQCLFQVFPLSHPVEGRNV